MIKIEEMLKIATIKDGDGYSEGRYFNRKPVPGVYVQAKENSFLERVEIMAKHMFKLESDPENYAHEARVETMLALQEYYDRFGYNKSDKEVRKWVYTVVKRKLRDMAKISKSNTYTFDFEKNKFIINNILHMDGMEDADFEELENEIFDKYGENGVSNEFTKWLKDNASSVLTDRQLKYLNNEIIVSYKGENKIKKNISKRVLEEFGEYQRDYFKNKNLSTKVSRVEDVLNSIENNTFEYDMKNKYCKNEKYDFIIMDLYENISFKYLKDITKMINTGKKIKNTLLMYEIINYLVNLKNNLEKSYHIS